MVGGFRKTRRLFLYVPRRECSVAYAGRDPFACRRASHRQPPTRCRHCTRSPAPTGSVVMCAVCAFTRAAPAPMTACWGGAVGHPTHPPCANRRTAFRRPVGANPILYSDSGRNTAHDPVERLAGACMPTCRQNAGIVARESRVRNGAPECEERHGEDMMNAEPSAEKPLRKKYFSVCHLKASRERWAGMLRGKGALMGSRHAAPKACGERSLSRRGSRPVMKPMLTWMRSVRPAVPDKRGSCPPPSPAPEMRRFAASIDGMGTMSRFRLGRHRERASTQWDGVHIRCRHESHPGCMEMIGCEGIVRRCRVRRRVSGFHPVSCKSGLDAGANMRTGCRGHGKQDWKQPRKKYFQVCHLKASREWWVRLHRIHRARCWLLTPATGVRCGSSARVAGCTPCVHPARVPDGGRYRQLPSLSGLRRWSVPGVYPDSNRRRCGQCLHAVEDGGTVNRKTAGEAIFSGVSPESKQGRVDGFPRTSATAPAADSAYGDGASSLVSWGCIRRGRNRKQQETVF